MLAVLGLEEREVRSIAAGGNSSWCLVRPSTSRDQRFQEPGLALLRPATLALLEHNQPLDQVHRKSGSTRVELT